MSCIHRDDQMDDIYDDHLPNDDYDNDEELGEYTPTELDILRAEIKRVEKSLAVEKAERERVFKENIKLKRTIKNSQKDIIVENRKYHGKETGHIQVELVGQLPKPIYYRPEIWKTIFSIQDQILNLIEENEKNDYRDRNRNRDYPHRDRDRQY